MKAVREDYDNECRQIARFAQPARSRFLATERDQGKKRRTWNNSLLDPHGIEAFRTLTNGMTSGLSSPSRPWFTLTVEDEALTEEEGVREWLSAVEKLIYSRLALTNFYGAAKSGYGELGLFGTEACVMAENRETLAVCEPLTFGEYWIAIGESQTADTLYRSCALTVRQAVQKFGNAVSKDVKRAYDASNYTQNVDVYHAIEPNDEHDDKRFGSKPWRSVYWDAATSKDETLKVSGFEEQPFWAPRWDVVGNDTYGTSPGMEALPALRELQMQTKRRNEAIDQLIKPEIVVPAGLRLTGEPGRKVSASGVDPDKVFVPYQMPYQAIQAIGGEIDKCRMQIDGLSFADLFNAITNMRGIQPRNVEEIASRNEEKLTQLGPVIERVSGEKLKVVIDRMYGMLLRGGFLPPVPPALNGVEFNVEFVSILAQMQRMVGIGQIERTMAFAGNNAGVNPDILDNIEFDETMREYASRAGTPPKLIRSAKKVAEMREARAQQKQAAETAAMMPAMQQGADAARLLSETDVGGGQSLLQSMMPA